MAALVRPGITTLELDRAAEQYIRAQGGQPGFKGYHGFQHTLCISLNEECVHGVPGQRTLGEGDIVSLDCGVLLEGLYTDACLTVPVGKISSDAAHLLEVTQEALAAALEVVREGCKVGDISAVIEATIRAGKCRPVRGLTGHGLGRTLHQFPDVPNAGTADTGAILPARTIIAIEPIVTMGSSDEIAMGDDGWTLRMRDGALSAHFEHTILITERGCEILA